MSVEVMSKVFKYDMPELQTDKGERVNDSSCKFVLLSLADHCNDDGYGAYPSITTICKKTNLSRPTVCNALSALKHNGYISYVGISPKGTSDYTIDISELVNPANHPQLTQFTSTSKPSLPEPYLNHPLTIGAKPAPISGASGEEYVPLEEESVSNKIIVPTTITAFYLSNQQIGRWRNCWKGFKNRKQEREWLQMESLYNPETIKQKIDWAVQEGIPPSRIASSIITALKNNVKPDKPEEGTTWETVKTVEI